MGKGLGWHESRAVAWCVEDREYSLREVGLVLGKGKVRCCNFVNGEKTGGRKWGRWVGLVSDGTRRGLMSRGDVVDLSRWLDEFGRLRGGFRELRYGVGGEIELVGAGEGC
jgi:hypothetical protein